MRTGCATIRHFAWRATPKITRCHRSRRCRGSKTRSPVASNRLTRAYEQVYVDELVSTTDLIVVDIDSTDDQTHGNRGADVFPRLLRPAHASPAAASTP